MAQRSIPHERKKIPDVHKERSTKTPDDTEPGPTTANKKERKEHTNNKSIERNK